MHSLGMTECFLFANLAKISPITYNTQKVLGYAYFCAKLGVGSGAYLSVCEELNDRRFVRKEACHRTFLYLFTVGEWLALILIGYSLLKDILNLVA